MPYIRKAHHPGPESRGDARGRLIREARYGPEEYVMRWAKEHKPLPEKGKERVGAN
jgi:hypothetical protein